MPAYERTDQPPLPGHAYHFNVPTGGVGSDRLPFYFGWGHELVFEGEWAEARAIGVLRSKECSQVVTSNWPEERVFRLPESLLARATSPLEDTLLRSYLAKVRVCLEARDDTPSLSDKECQLRAARAAQNEVDTLQAGQ